MSRIAVPTTLNRDRSDTLQWPLILRYVAVSMIEIVGMNTHNRIQFGYRVGDIRYFTAIQFHTVLLGNQ